MMNDITKNQIALAGEFAVLSQLALQGFDANMTLGNTKSVDILLSHPETGKMNRLEVKTHHHNNSYRSADFGYVESHWRMHKKHEKDSEYDLFYCFVSIAKSNNAFDFYIVPGAVVSKFIRESHQYWLSGSSERHDSDMRSFMLGKEGETYKLDMPIAEKYRNNWEALKYESVVLNTKIEKINEEPGEDSEHRDRMMSQSAERLGEILIDCVMEKQKNKKI